MVNVSNSFFCVPCGLTHVASCSVCGRQYTFDQLIDEICPDCTARQREFEDRRLAEEEMNRISEERRRQIEASSAAAAARSRPIHRPVPVRVVRSPVIDRENARDIPIEHISKNEEVKKLMNDPDSEM